MREILPYTPEEMMTIAAARTLRNGAVCFVGVGPPSVAAVLARGLHAPDVVLIYESGLIDSTPSVAPLSIADSELAETAQFVVSVPEMFSYWLQAGRIDTGYLGAAQMDRFANINTTVVGAYPNPKVRMPGGGGAPEIAAHAKEIVVIVRHSRRAFVSQLDFRTSGGEHVRKVVSDLGVLEPDPGDGQLMLTGIYAGVSLDEVRAETSWPLRVCERLPTVEPPSTAELSALRDLNDRTLRAHR